MKCHIDKCMMIERSNSAAHDISHNARIKVAQHSDVDRSDGRINWASLHNCINYSFPFDGVFNIIKITTLLQSLL